ncbi:MAG: hypothetical protein DME06_04065 [Candidatus Rokuibacteriota bacterium]|nr:MAG: hypothetical protein DME06_04065 [Candidatus Rokubacteria bacterium]
MQAGASPEKVAQVGSARTSDLFDDRERTALEYAETITRTGERVSDELFARVRAHFTEAEVVELTAAAALENLRSKFNTALVIEAGILPNEVAHEPSLAQATPDLVAAVAALANAAAALSRLIQALAPAPDPAPQPDAHSAPLPERRIAL